MVKSEKNASYLLGGLFMYSQKSKDIITEESNTFPQTSEKDYLSDLVKIKETISDNRNKAMVVVNSVMILTYYKIGTIINQRKTWGNKYIQRLSEDLKEYGKGYSYDQLKRMSLFAKTFSEDEIRARPAPQIPWRTIIAIMQKSSSKEEMLWYINQTYQNRWSRSALFIAFYPVLKNDNSNKVPYVFSSRNLSVRKNGD